MTLPKENKKCTYADYLTWQDNKRWEVLDGIPCMQVAPSWQHQVISRELMTQFNLYLKDKECQVFASPFDLRIPENDESDEEVETILQPDIVVVCDKNKLKGSGYYGVPSLVVEITSPSTTKVDKILKFNKYEHAGVKEYWIVEPDGKVVSVFTLQSNNRYGRPETYSEENSIKVSVLPDFIVDLNTIFGSI